MSFPTLLYGDTSEEFHKYVQNFIDVNYNSTTGITTLTVQAFRPNDANAIASTLLDLAEGKVNELNQRIRSDAIRVADDEVHRSEARLSDAMVKVTAFRNRELMLDPEKNSVLLAQLIGQLGTDLAQELGRARPRRRALLLTTPACGPSASTRMRCRTKSSLNAARSPTIRRALPRNSRTTSGSQPNRNSRRPR